MSELMEDDAEKQRTVSRLALVVTTAADHDAVSVVACFGSQRIVTRTVAKADENIGITELPAVKTLEPTGIDSCEQRVQLALGITIQFVMVVVKLLKTALAVEIVE